MRFRPRQLDTATQNWRGCPRVSREVVVNLIGSVTTKGGLTIRSKLDESSYETGRKVTPEQINALSIERDKSHGESNYTLAPRQ